MNTKGLKKFLINTEDGLRTFMYRILSYTKKMYIKLLMFNIMNINKNLKEIS